MHDQLRQDLSQAIEAMTDAQKLELIEGLAQSLRASKNDEGHDLGASQKEQLLESVRRISSLPMEGPGRFSGRDHDRVLYDPTAKNNTGG